MDWLELLCFRLCSGLLFKQLNWPLEIRLTNGLQDRFCQTMGGSPTGGFAGLLRIKCNIHTDICISTSISIKGIQMVHQMVHSRIWSVSAWLLCQKKSSPPGASVCSDAPLLFWRSKGMNIKNKWKWPRHVAYCPLMPKNYSFEPGCFQHQISARSVGALIAGAPLAVSRAFRTEVQVWHGKVFRIAQRNHHGTEPKLICLEVKLFRVNLKVVRVTYIY